MNLVANVFVEIAVRNVAGGLCGNIAGKHSDIALDIAQEKDRGQIVVQVGSEVSSSGSWQPTCICIRALVCKCLRVHACARASQVQVRIELGSTKGQIPVGFRVCKN